MGALWSFVSACRPCAGARQADPAFASHRSVKTEGIERRSKRRRVPSTGCQQPVDNPAHGHVGSSSTEGTSGAANLAPLRGGTGEAALGPRLERPRERARRRGVVHVHASGRNRGAVKGGQQVRRKPSLWGGIAEAFVPHVAHAGRAPGTAGLSSRRCRGPTTGGARVDRVGAKLLLRAPFGVPAREASSVNNGRPLARESSVGVAWKPGRAQ